jgi:hypothetical protein
MTVTKQISKQLKTMGKNKDNFFLRKLRQQPNEMGQQQKYINKKK